MTKSDEIGLFANPAHTPRMARRGARMAQMGDISQQAESDGVLTLLEVAARLRCSKAHVSNLMNGQIKGTPQLRTLRLGRRKLVLRSTFDQWLVEVEQASAKA